MIWADRVAIGLLAVAAMFFAYIYATDKSWLEALMARVAYIQAVAPCDLARDTGREPKEPCTAPDEKIIKVRTIASTAVEFLIFAFCAALPAWLVLRLIDAKSGGPERRRRSPVPSG